MSRAIPVRRSAFRLVVVLLALAHASSAGAQAGPWDDLLGTAPHGVTLEIAESYYEVSGTTAAELRTGLDRTAMRVAGRPALAVTLSDVRWPYRFARRGQVCVVTDVEVTLGLTVRLPIWTDREAGDPGLLGAWEAFVDDLRRHERGHVVLNVESGAAVLEAIRSLGATRCDEIRAAVDRAANGALALYGRKHVDYDRGPDTPRAEWPPAG